MKKVLFFTLLPFSLLIRPAIAGEGKFINPITDICWNCVFPVHISGVNTTPSYKDFGDHSRSELCSCVGSPPKVGLPLSFWEPAALVDVTRTPYELTAWGGVTVGKADIRKRGAVSHLGDGGRTSFYNVHYYNFPVFSWLSLLPSFPCVDQSTLEISYLSEFDPFWDDDQWASVVSPEVFLFANPLAQAACIGDCAASTMDKPIDKLFWCAGCSGVLYPFVGHVPHHIGGIQASYLLVQRLLSKIHSIGMGFGFEKDNFCDKTKFLRLKKTIYKTQLVHPIANTQGPCLALGKSDAIWGSGKTFPYKGEDFVYLIWKKKQCCLDVVKPSMFLLKGPA